MSTDAAEIPAARRSGIMRMKLGELELSDENLLGQSLTGSSNNPAAAFTNFCILSSCTFLFEAGATHGATKCSARVQYGLRGGGRVPSGPTLRRTNFNHHEIIPKQNLGTRRREHRGYGLHRRLREGQHAWELGRLEHNGNVRQRIGGHDFRFVRHRHYFGYRHDIRQHYVVRHRQYFRIERLHFGFGCDARHSVKILFAGVAEGAG
jgi:hypothetical protein